MPDENKIYQATAIKQLKSYPTYQFHAFSNAKCSTADTFVICILETFKWLNYRMKGYENLPEEFSMPLPDDYKNFDMDKLHSFSLDLGFQIDVVYVQKKGIWSFRITEIDPGANLGSPTERKPVQGRTFTTEISYRLHKDCVEIGVRTICSEPADATENCEVFRPAVVKALIANNNVGLKYKYPIDGKVTDIESNSNLEYLFSVIKDEKFDLPIVIVAESGYEDEPKPDLPDLKSLAEFNSAYSVTRSFSFNLDMNKPAVSKMQIDMSKVENKCKSPKSVHTDKTSKSKKEKNDTTETQTAVKTKLPSVDTATLADKLAGFGVVVTVKEKYFEKLKHELDINLDYGEIIIIHHGNIVHQQNYKSYCDTIENYHETLKKEVQVLPKRAVYSFGSIKFTSDARISELQDKNESNLTKNEKIELLTRENAELRQQLSDERKRSVDASLREESSRVYQKKIRQLEEENESLTEKYSKAVNDYSNILNSYNKMSDIISFYKSKSEVAAEFPTETAKVCDWLEDKFSEYFVVSQNARNLMKKYSGSLDVALLCDGLLYLSGYARYKRNEISEDILELYAQANNWSVDRCGTESVRVYPDIYSCNVGSKKYTLDYHIKYGVKSQQLIRVYFCWDDEIKKIIIGSMPGHLATVKQKT